MWSLRQISCAGLIALAGTQLGATVQAQAPDTVDDLYQVESRNFDEVFLLPGVDFATYQKVMIDDPEVAFDRNWLRDYNRGVASLGDRIDDRQAEDFLRQAREGLSEVFAGAFGGAGYEVVAAPGPDVLRIGVSLVNLRINAPDVNPSARSRSYAREAGQARIIVEARDSTSGALLGRAVDARRIGDAGFLRVRSSVSNRSDFERAFRRWASLSVEGLDALKERSRIGTE
jgi:hypothetical protein